MLQSFDASVYLVKRDAYTQRSKLDAFAVPFSKSNLMSKKFIFVILILVLTSVAVLTYRFAATRVAKYEPRFPPTYTDIKYGEREKCFLDVYQSPVSKPQPCVLFMHGGGWTNFNRHSAHKIIDIQRLIDHNITVVTFDYTFLFDGEKQGLDAPVSLPMSDAVQALQFIRSESSRFGIDKESIVGVGASSGGCTMLWLACHDDLAKQNGSNALAQETTRLQSVYCYDAQTTLDPYVMRDWIPNIQYGQNAFGFRSIFQDDAAEFERFYAASKSPPFASLIHEYSPVSHLTIDDPSIRLLYSASGLSEKQSLESDPTHSSLFGAILMEKSYALGRSGDTLDFVEDLNEARDKLTDLIILDFNRKR
jgi:acetyl esterase/lipase